MTVARQLRGRLAEDVAARRLGARGYSVVARNVRLRRAECGVGGEIDIVALDGGTLVFVEVKCGVEGSSYGPERPVMAVGRAKQLKLRRLAMAWLATAERRRGWAGIRFDVIGVTVDSSNRVVDVEHLRGAF
jgi:putative endonuclease